jgi:hypothetical protein
MHRYAATLPLAPLLVVALLGVALLVGACGNEATLTDVRNNQIKVIAPYRAKGTWVFDDSATGLKAEPFVQGIPEMIDRLVEDIPDARQGFRLTFSAAEFPGYELAIERGEPRSGGYTYRDPGTGRQGWLCPALFKYFRYAPKTIYVKADPGGN